MYGPKRAGDSWRARIGVVMPSTNTIFESWFPKVAPEGVSFHSSRMAFDASRSIDGLEEMAKHEVEAAKLVSDCDPDVIMHACTASCLLKGRAADIELIQSIQSVTGVPCVTITDAILRAFDALNIRKICIASPYTRQMEEIERKFFEECSIEVDVAAGLNIQDPKEISDPTPGEIYRFGRSVFRKGADALLVTCGAFRAHHVVAALEDDLGVPVITSVTAPLWASLRLAGITAPIEGYGRLLMTQDILDKR